MAQYRVSEFTPEQRAEVALHMFVAHRERGVVTQLAQRYGVSRALLYELRDRMVKVAVDAMQPRPAGRPAQTPTLKVDKDFINQAIVTLLFLKGTVRDIRLGLQLLLGVTRSHGYISQVLTAAGERAEAYHLSLRIPLPILGEAHCLQVNVFNCLSRAKLAFFEPILDRFRALVRPIAL